MNKVYKVVWNATLNAWVAVSELAKGKTKTKSQSQKKLAVQAILVSAVSISGISQLATAASYQVGGGNAAVTNSIAIGTDASTASSVSNANQSVAIGYSTKASGDQTVALGANVVASGNSAVAIGGDDIDRIASNKTINNSYESLTGVRLVEGKYPTTTASGAGAVAIGTQATASGNFATSLGMTSTASGDASSALGVFANASGGAALAIGAISKAKAEQSIALGTNSTVDKAASNSIAIGNGAVANNKDSIAIGSGSAADSKTLSNQAYLVGGTAKGEMNIGDRRITGVSAGSADTDAVNVSQLKQVAKDAAAKTTVSKGKNITVKSTQNADGSTNYEVATADDLAVDSLTAGNTVVNDKGLSFTDATGAATGPSIGATGINAGNTVIANVANGAVNVASKDAVNGSQLYNAQNNVANVIGGESKIDPNTGNITTSNIGGTGKNTISEAVAAAKTTVSKGKNMEVKATQNADGSTNYEVATADDLAVDSLTAGNTVVNDKGLSFTDATGAATGPSIGATGINAGGTVISNVANGAISATSKDAINGSQLSDLIGAPVTTDSNGKTVVSNIGGTAANNINDAIQHVNNTANAGWNVTGSGKNAANIGPNAKLDVVGDSNITVAQIGTDQDAKLEINLSKDLKVDSIVAGNSILNNSGLSFVNSVGAVTGPSISSAGINAGNTVISNVANGKASNDAVNFSQLTALQSYVSSAVNSINVADPKFKITADDPTKATTVVADSTIDIGLSDDENNLNVSILGQTIDFSLNKKLTLDSVTTGSTKISDDGLQFLDAQGKTTGPSVASTGINAGDIKVSNVAKGDISASSKDAVNGSQLSNLIGAPVTTDANGKTVAPNLGGTTANNVNDAIQQVNNTAKAGWNVTGTGTNSANIGPNGKLDVKGTNSNLQVSQTGQDQDAVLEIALSDNLKVDSIIAGNSTLNTDGLQLKDIAGNTTVLGNSSLSFIDATGKATGPSISMNGLDAGTKVISNVGAGTISSTSTQAVNGSQLSNLMGTAVTTVKDENGDISFVAPNLGGTTANNVNDAIQQVNTTATDALTTANKGFALKAQDGKTVQKALGEAVEVVGADSNIETLVTNGQVQIRLADDISVANSISAGGNTLNKKGLTVGDSTLTSDGLSIANGGPSVLSTGINAGNKVISSVAAGAITATSKDAVNGSQLYVAQNNVANVIGGSTTIDPNTGNISTSNIGGTGKNTISEAVAAAKTTVSKGKNMQVKATQNADGSTNYEVATADDLDVTSVKAGDTLINTKGLTIANGPSITTSGIDAGNKVISRVAAGSVSSTSTDAVNGSQLYSAQNNVANVIGGSTTIDPTTGAVTTSNIGGTGKNTISEAVAAAKTTVTNGKNITVKETKNADGSSNYQVATADNLDVTSLKAGNTLINNSGLTITGGPSVLASGINAGNKKITSVANGDVTSTSSDAVNGSQLYAVDSRIDQILNQNIANLEQGFSLSTNGQNKAAVVSGANIDIGTAADEKNLTVTKSGNTIDFALNPDLNVTSVTAGGTVLNGNGLSFVAQDANGNPIQTGPSIGINGIDAGNKKMTNVANGDISVSSKDAVNGSQLYNAQNNVANVIGGSTTIDPNTGNISTSNIGGTGKNTISEAVAAAKTTVSKGKNMQVKATQNADGSTNYEVATADNLDVTSLKAGNSLLNNQGLSIVGGPSVLVSGINAGNKKITNVASGSITATSQDAVNGSQLYALDSRLDTIINQNINTLQQGFNVSSNGNDSQAVLAGETIDIGTASTESNLTVSKTGNTIDFALNRDLTLDSVNANGTIINGDGLSFQTIDANGDIILAGPSINAIGINAGNTVITNVSNGAVTAASKDAVNGSQLYNAQNNVANIIGGHTTIDPNTGNITASDIGGTGANNIHDAIQSVNNAATNANQGWNMTTNGANKTNVKPGDTVNFGNTDGNVSITNDGSNISVNLNKDQNLGKDGSITTGNTTVNNSGLTIQNTDPNKVVSVTDAGINAGNNKVTNVEDGQIAAGSKDAVNGGQIQEMMGAGAYDAKGNLSNIGGTGANNINDAIQTVNKNIADNKVSVKAGSDNVTVSSNTNATEYTVDISKDLNVNSVTAKDIKADTITAGNTTIDNKGVSIKDGPSMTASGVDAGKKAISNVSNGVQNSDAVNMGQMAQYLGGGAGYNNITESFDAPTYNVNGGSYNNVGDALGALNQADQVMGDRITNLGDQLQQAFYSTNQRIDDVEKRANAGIAAAMALETAPYVAGKYTYAAGASYHGGENAIGVTLRKTADNGRWSLTSGVAFASQGDPSVRVGISGVID
ncbi:YadA-like family protein [Acinetobacter sp. FL51]|uniref:ESPR-type extended signal peptide-containing protein n=1 Tax=Acinetobacter sp. FL51 TaxID=2777978 RepID=UPI0018E19319|nr:ESPR-type extended signal peptide-containing protein [Acinetobacter sp. FL51]MBI1452564.1 YadA-like family protein [Acinetobacter sp. FL51]